MTDVLRPSSGRPRRIEPAGDIDGEAAASATALPPPQRSLWCSAETTSIGCASERAEGIRRRLPNCRGEEGPHLDEPGTVHPARAGFDAVECRVQAPRDLRAVGAVADDLGERERRQNVEA